MAPSFSRVSSGALLLALAYNARPVNADYWEDVDNCKLVLDDLPADLTADFCHDWTYGYEPEPEYVTVVGEPVTVTEYPDAKTCEGEGYSTTTKYPEYTSEPSEGYVSSQPTPTWDSSISDSTSVPDDSTTVPSNDTTISTDSTTVLTDDSTTVPTDSTTTAPDQSSATDAHGGADVTVTSTIYTTYWTTSTIYDGYPAGYPEATPAPYRRRQVAALGQRASWCVDRPCRLVQYDDETIFEACKKYLGWNPETKTKWVPGYTVTVTSYPTDCKKHDEYYQPDVYPTKEEYKPEYPSETPYPAKDEYKPDPYPTKEEYKPEPYQTKEDEYKPNYPTEAPYPENYYPEEPEYESEPAPEPYYETEPGYGEDYEDGYYEDGSDKQPWESDDGHYEDDSDYRQPWENSFDNNYSGPDGPKPWDDNEQTSELADAIEAVGYDNAAEESGLEDAPWNAIPTDYPWKRDYPINDDSSYEEKYPEKYPEKKYPEKKYPEEDCPEEEYPEEKSDDYDVVWVDENGYPIEDEKSYEPSKHDYSYKPDDKEEGSYPKEYPPNLYGPDVGKENESYESDDSYDHHPDGPWGSSDDHYEKGSEWSLPETSEYEGDEFESDYSAPADEPSYGSSWGEDGVDY